MNDSHTLSHQVDDYMKNKRNHPLTKLFLRFSPEWHVWLFMGTQFVYAIITTLPTTLFYHSFSAHTLFIVFILMMSVYNGGAYYIEVFSKRYRDELEKLDQLSSLDIDENMWEATFGETSNRGGASENPSEKSNKTAVAEVVKDDGSIRPSPSIIQPISIKDLFRKAD